jgi:hypothetical protein
MMLSIIFLFSTNPPWFGEIRLGRKGFIRLAMILEIIYTRHCIGRLGESEQRKRNLLPPIFGDEGRKEELVLPPILASIFEHTESYVPNFDLVF